MSGMTAGGVIEGDRRLRDYELRSRYARRIRNNQEAWKIYEADYANEMERKKEE